MAGLNTKKTKDQISAAIGRIIERIDVGRIIETAGPRMLPGIIGSIPQLAGPLAQMGITPDNLAGILSEPSTTQGGEQRFEPPDGGARRLMRDLPIMTEKDLKEGIYFLMSDPRCDEVADIIGNWLYWGIGAASIVDADPMGDTPITT